MRILLIDFENINVIDFSKIPQDFKVHVFLGAKQDKIPTTVVLQTQKLLERVQWHLTPVCGSNALDFCLIYFAGKCIEKDPKTPVWILSKDKGFTHIVNFAKPGVIKCVNNVEEVYKQSKKDS